MCLVLGAITKGYVPSETTSPYVWKPNYLPQAPPTNFHWGSVNGTNFLTQMRNERVPKFCDASWAHATTSALGDRIAVARGGAFPEINLAPQVLLTCNQKNDGCHGGDPLQAFQWMSQNNITEENCAPYQGMSWVEGMKCTPMAICMECFSGSPCFVPPKYNNYRVGEYGRLPTGQTSMQNEVMARGPIVCSIYADPILNFTGTGVYASNNPGLANHVISIVGWGVTSDNIPYWAVRNSWGEYWGDNGFIKIYRGNNTLQIESNCIYAVPINTWQNQTYPHLNPPADPSKLLPLKEFNPRGRCAIDHTKKMTPVITQPLPEDYIDLKALPANFFYGNVDGQNYLSWHVNQHLPQYCGSCWAQAGAASIADRIKIATNNQFPRVALSVQVLLNCVAEGTCDGGWGGGPYTYAHNHGIPEFGCQPYLAKNLIPSNCSPMEQCKNCRWNTDFSQHCWAVENFNKWYVGDHGTLRGADKMKKEIFARGPISCGIDATTKFEQTYTGGIYSEKTNSPFPNHYVSVNGWGVDPNTNEEYWIVRNSWGTHFGENGFFRIKMYKDNLGLDTYECFWGVPTLAKPSSAVASE